MNRMARKIIFLMMLVGLSTSVSGCANSLQKCSALVGTVGYNLCLAEHGNRKAQYEVGLSAYEAKDMEATIKWLEKAAKPNEGVKMVYMPAVDGQSYGTIKSLPRNGHPGYREAQALLAHIYAEGIGVERDEIKASHYRMLSFGIRK
ncbi:MAG: sel1 repeat family protein [Kordiimonadaceae bacterium]|jgi:hypothetical protein|nr:sel1 repeat family protein [Kordiimonadaceae bacterium]MBT6035326.1 sel1 repeat family protein [Kordiimonadaceae bacterium]MBT6329568.1 sel1 repeat family protein [Kordiimonadaceae bacterium]